MRSGRVALPNVLSGKLLSIPRATCFDVMWTPGPRAMRNLPLAWSNLMLGRSRDLRLLFLLLVIVSITYRPRATYPSKMVRRISKVSVSKLQAGKESCGGSGLACSTLIRPCTKTANIPRCVLSACATLYTYSFKISLVEVRAQCRLRLQGERYK